MSALPRPDLRSGAHRDLVDALHDLHHRAGWPSLRTLARESGVSHTTVSKTFSQPALPAWGTLEVLVEAMDRDTTQFHDLWLAASTPTDGGRPAAPRIAGRATELEAVRRHLETGTGLLLVTGEAGIGKTTLVSAAAARTDVVVALGHCLPLSTEVPLMPIVDALRAARDGAGAQWSEAVAGLEHSLRHHLARLLPDIAPVTVELTDDGLGGLRQFLAVSQTLMGLAKASPFGLTIEDLHWADAATLDWLEHHLTTGVGVPLVATWRSEDLDTSARHVEWLARVRRLPCVREVVLAPLSLEDTAAQLRLLDPDLDDGRVGRIHSRSRGHPLFTEQLARGTEDDALPEALSVALDRRLSRLAGPALDVVSILGVADRRLSVPTLQRATGLTSPDLLAGLRDLRGAHLIDPAPTVEVGLAHPLLAEAARGRLVPGEAPVLHAALAGSLAASGGASPGELAVHWQAAGRPDQEIGCRVAAARLAGERLARREELTSWVRALELYDSGVRTDEVEIWDLLRRAMSAAYESGDPARARPLVERALALDVLDTARVHLLQVTGDLLYDAGERERGMLLLDEAHDLVLRLSPHAELVSVVDARFWTLVSVGRVRQALHDAAEALAHLGELSDLRLDRFRRSYDIVRRIERGDFDGAVALAEEQGRAAHGQDLMLELMAAATAVDTLLHTAAPPQRATAIADRALLAAQPWHLDDTWIVALLRTNMSWVHLRAGDTSSAAAVLEPSTRAAPTVLTWTAQAAMAAVELRRGEVERALERTRAAEARVVNRDFIWAEAVPLHADIALWAGDAGSAVRLLEQALTVYLPLDAAPQAADALVLLARATADLLGGTTDRARRATAHDNVAGWRSRCTADPLGAPAVAAAAPAWRTQWDCELARILGAGTADAWVRAASEWDRLGRPHDAAYCRWRAAQCALRDGQGTAAARLLKKAATDAREHVPLSDAIATTRFAAR